MEIKEAYLLAAGESKNLNSHRFSFFNFFIVLAGLLVNAIALCIKDAIWILAIIASISLLLISLLFIFLERRNANNFKRVNDLLLEYEKIMMNQGNDFKYLYSFLREVYHENNKKYKMGQTKVFKTIYSVFFFLGFGTMILSIVLWVT